MTGRIDFAYAQARLQARHGLRPTEAAWHRLEASKDLGHYLQAARASSLRPWIQHLSARMDSHGIERSLRQDWRDYVAGVAVWQPAPWRAAAAWTAVLVDLPAVAHLLHSSPAQAWMRQDPVLARLAVDDPVTRREALLTSHLAPVGRAWLRDRSVLDGWLDHWRRLWPADGRAVGAAMDRLVALTARHLAAMAGNAGADADGGRLRAELVSSFTAMFRRHGQHPIAMYCHLGLVALDLERLRAGLVRRSLFAKPPGAGA